MNSLSWGPLAATHPGSGWGSARQPTPARISCNHLPPNKQAPRSAHGGGRTGPGGWALWLLAHWDAAATALVLPRPHLLAVRPAPRHLSHHRSRSGCPRVIPARLPALGHGGGCGSVACPAEPDGAAAPAQVSDPSSRRACPVSPVRRRRRPCECPIVARESGVKQAQCVLRGVLKARVGVFWCK